MKGKDLYDAVEFIGADIIDMAENRRFKKSPWRSVLASAAVFLLLLGSGIFVFQKYGHTAILPPNVNDTQVQAPGYNSLEQDHAFSWDPESPVNSEEVMLSNGIKLGMTYNQTYPFLKSPSEEQTDEQEGTVLADEGVLYHFTKSGDKLQLSQIEMTNTCFRLRTFRDLKIGQSISSVFEQIPARDQRLQEWETQVLYDAGDEKAFLEYVDLDHYQIQIQTDNFKIQLAFTAEEIKIDSITMTMIEPEMDTDLQSN